MAFSILEIVAVVVGFLGYMLVTFLAFCHQEPACWAYSIITLAALAHLVVAVVRNRQGGDDGDDGPPPPAVG